MTAASRIDEAFDAGKGVLRLMPVFIPRRFSEAGRRLRLHPDDYFALGMARGSIKERWLASVIPAVNGPLAPADEGLSYAWPASDRAEDKFTLRDAAARLGADLVGHELHSRFGGWPCYSKFFDYLEPLFFHLHLDEAAAALVGRLAKPEAYYFPPQMNDHLGRFPHTFFGFDPDTTREEVIERLAMFERGDNRITELSRAHRIQLGTGWYTPPGVLHAPGSVLTYEPQWNSDVNAVLENRVGCEVYPREFLVENCPEDRKAGLNHVMSMIDWDKNVDPHYKRTYFRPPVDCPGGDAAHHQRWIVYGNPYFGAKELLVQPGCSVTVKDPAAHGAIVVQGHGRVGVHDAEAAGMLRFGQMSGDEFFVSEGAAAAGVLFENRSRWEPMVVLRHFGPNHPAMP